MYKKAWYLISKLIKAWIKRHWKTTANKNTRISYCVSFRWKLQLCHLIVMKSRFENVSLEFTTYERLNRMKAKFFFEILLSPMTSSATNESKMCFFLLLCKIPQQHFEIKLLCHGAWERFLKVFIVTPQLAPCTKKSCDLFRHFEGKQMPRFFFFLWKSETINWERERIGGGEDL